MKIIIDIDKEDYEYIRENMGMHYTMTPGICEAIFDGTPFEEAIEKMKAEILSECPNTNARMICMSIIDKHIYELKGENK